MGTVPPEFYDDIPAAIRPLILECPVLPSENPKFYSDLLVELWRIFRPTNALQWFDLKKLADLIWDEQRLGRIKAEIINLAQKKSLSQLLLSMTNERVCNYTPSGNITQAEECAVNWFTDPVAKKEIQAQIAKFGYSQKTIDAKAFIQHADVLATIEKMLASNEAQKLVVRRAFEERQNVLELQADSTDGKGEVLQPQTVAPVMTRRITTSRPRTTSIRNKKTSRVTMGRMSEAPPPSPAHGKSHHK
jgi:hypothetical protein